VPICPELRENYTGPILGAAEALFAGIVESLAASVPGDDRCVGTAVSEACGSNVEDPGFERGHRILRIVGKGNKPGAIPLVPARLAPSTWRSANEPRTDLVAPQR
jgi:hypothetical protein